MCGQVGQFSCKMSHADWVDAQQDMKHLQAILDSVPPTRSYHTPNGKRCWIITMDEPTKMTEATFGYYQLNYREEKGIASIFGRKDTITTRTKTQIIGPI